jgi:N utilization substance protein A
LVRRLLELEIPEIHDGLVDIKAIAREPGVRSKVAVEARDKKIDPIGACIGNRGSRIRNIIDELRGEKIDIILWSERPEEFIAEALNPAEVKRVELDEEQRVATVYVDQSQLSLAIGKEGQNARLAAKITGWKIDIKGIPVGEEEEIGDGEETQDTP